MSITTADIIEAGRPPASPTPSSPKQQARPHPNSVSSSTTSFKPNTPPGPTNAEPAYSKPRGCQR